MSSTIRLNFGQSSESAALKDGFSIEKNTCIGYLPSPVGNEEIVIVEIQGELGFAEELSLPENPSLKVREKLGELLWNNEVLANIFLLK